MASKHKAPTEVTIASTTEETAFSAFVTKYWPHMVAIAVITSVAIVVSQLRRDAVVEEELASWSRLGQDVNFNDRIAPPSAPIMADVAETLEDGVAGPWAKALEIGRRLSDDDFAGAQRAIEELATTWPEHALAAQAMFPRSSEDAGPGQTLKNRVASNQAALDAWKKEHSNLFSNPDLPADAPRVRLNTSAGAIVIALDTVGAPLHAENFLNRCREGYYDGTKFHRVTDDSVFGGDPNSRDDDRSTWGKGGPEETIKAASNERWHFPGAVASEAAFAKAPSHGSRFYIVTSDDLHNRDGDYTVWGQVVEGMDVVTAVQSAPRLDTTPEEPVTIESTEIL